MILISFLEMEDKKKFRDYLTMDGVHCRDRRIPRCCALHYPASSPWMKLFSSMHDQSLITLTGFDHRTFRMLLIKFKPYFDQVLVKLLHLHQLAMYRRLIQ